MALGLDSIINRERMKAISKRVIHGGAKGEELARQAGVMPSLIEEAANSANVQYFVQGYHGESDNVIIP